MKNFFEHQDQARQKTHYLIFLFGCAMVATIALLYVALLLVSRHTAATSVSVLPSHSVWSPACLVGAVLIAFLTVGFGSGRKCGR